MDKIELIKSMVDHDKNNPNAWYLLGIEYLEMRMQSQALQAFTEALKYSDEGLKQKIIIELGRISTLNAPIKDQDIPCEETNNTCQPSESNIIPLKVLDGGRVEGLSKKDNNGLSVVRFKDVGGLDDIKESIKLKIVKPFINPDIFYKYKKKVGGGILLFGPPGCGKTFIARATAGECNARFMPIHITDILDPYVGVSSQNIKDIFENARAKKPSILFIDEIDTIGFSRSKSSSDYMRSVVNQLLCEIEGIDSSTDKLLIIGATNMPWDVDAAFKRPGRFDKTIFVSPPDELARIYIFKLKLEGKPIDSINYEILAKHTEFYSGADIENVVDLATEHVINDILSTGLERSIQTEDLLEAIANTKPSTIEWLRTIKNYVKYANQAGLYDDVEKYLSRHSKILS